MGKKHTSYWVKPEIRGFVKAAEVRDGRPKGQVAKLLEVEFV